MELTDRKKKVLRSVVDLYIRTAEPVGSKAITELPDMNYSSATIRNEMADLTAMGYLEQVLISTKELDVILTLFRKILTNDLLHKNHLSFSIGIVKFT